MRTIAKSDRKRVRCARHLAAKACEKEAKAVDQNRDRLYRRVRREKQNLKRERGISSQSTFKRDGKCQIPAVISDPRQGVEILQVDVPPPPDPYSILRWSRDKERLFVQEPYFRKQPHINAKMRSILIDWLVEVHYKSKFESPSLWLCVSILDRFLDHVVITRCKLQLIGIVSLFIASEFDVIRPHPLSLPEHCVYITDNAYTCEEVLEMEKNIRKQLRGHIYVATGFYSLKSYLDILNASDQLRNLAYYFAERNLQECHILNYPPSQFCAAVLYGALGYHADGKAVSIDSIWSIEHFEITGYSEAEVIPLALNLLRHVSRVVFTASGRELSAARKKYELHKYLGVSKLALPVLLY